MLISLQEERLAALRDELLRRGLDGFVVPISDEHMSEYIGAYAQRLQWLTGFNGSAGTAVVLVESAAIFVDGRYTLQVRDQVDSRLYSYQAVPENSPSTWLSEHAPTGGRIGFDPWLHGKPWVERTARAIEAKGATLVAVEGNPIDAIWADRPEPSLAPAIVHDLTYAGKSSREKRENIARELGSKGVDTAIVSALDSIAWLFNIRGSDIERTPVALCFAMAHADGTADLFIAPNKVSPELRGHLGEAVRVSHIDAFVPALKQLCDKKVAIDPESAVAAIFDILIESDAKIVESRDPCVLPKAIKNPAEQAGHRAAQVRDGTALTRFLHWLSVEAPQGGVTELGAAQRLHDFRRETGKLRDLSFDTISGSGPNGAIVHYRVSEQSNRLLTPDSVYLVDSGGQYPDGTTDVTRTVWIGPGQPSGRIKDRFTRVLKGHIALARAVFPKGTAGHQLDALARVHLWQAGADYAHGTGHGVGSFLSVHEGPQRIGKAAGGQTGTGQELLPGMILSNEPGFYQAGEYGIRIENLELVEPRDIPGAEGEFLGFEILTFAPIERVLVEPTLLDSTERAWWNTYHAQVLHIVGPQLETQALTWLQAQCAPLP